MCHSRERQPPMHRCTYKHPGRTRYPRHPSTCSATRRQCDDDRQRGDYRPSGDPPRLHDRRPAPHRNRLGDAGRGGDPVPRVARSTQPGIRGERARRRLSVVRDSCAPGPAADRSGACVDQLLGCSLCPAEEQLPPGGIPSANLAGRLGRGVPNKAASCGHARRS